MTNCTHCVFIVWSRVFDNLISVKKKKKKKNQQMQDSASAYFIKGCVIACIRFEVVQFVQFVLWVFCILKNFALKWWSPAWETDTNRREREKEGIKLPTSLKLERNWKKERKERIVTRQKIVNDCYDWKVLCKKLQRDKIVCAW